MQEPVVAADLEVGTRDVGPQAVVGGQRVGVGFDPYLPTFGGDQMDCADEVADRSKIDVAAVRGGRGRAGDRLALAAAQREHGQAAVVEREVRRPETDAGLDADERPGLLIAGRRVAGVDRVRQVSLSAEVGPVTSSSLKALSLSSRTVHPVGGSAAAILSNDQPRPIARTRRLLWAASATTRTSDSRLSGTKCRSLRTLTLPSQLANSQFWN
jgi:hypothetical protein